MMKTRYHPLVDGDSEGKDKYPLFRTEDGAAAVTGQGYYLEEMFPRFYRLCRGNGSTARHEKDARIHCPLCGNVMDMISASDNRKRPAMYTCRKCNKERK